MCGIAGYLGPDLAPSQAEQVLRAMTDAVAHRGPDEMGIHVDGELGLSHRRLAIVGLADGQQPMLSEDGRFIVSFNGEIFNYVELRDDPARTLPHRLGHSAFSAMARRSTNSWRFRLR